MGSLGILAMYTSLVCIVVTIAAAVLGARGSDARTVRLAEYATYGTAIALSVAVGALQLALLSLDFSLQYIIDYTSSTLSPLYRVGAMWAGQGGSLLLWAWIVSLCAAWITYTNRIKHWEISAYTTAVFAVVGGLFAVLVTFFASPFAAATEAANEGFGLNPLLQDPLQIIHPLALYAGYVLYTVPFAIVVGALINGDVSGPWLKIANRWNVISWIALTLGIVLGARWAYAELGWGGYWAWDPVENASLLPWLTGTLLLHTGLSIRGGSRLRMSGVIVTMVTFILCLFGTFLTRSGVISSVHAFGESNLGTVLGAAIAVFVVACGALVVWRLPQLRVIDPERRGHGWLGQFILLILLVAITVAVLWGTMFPLFNRVITGEEIAVTPGFFRVVVTPLGIAILGLLAISPLLPGQQVADTKREIGIRVAIFVAVFGGIMLISHGANFGVALVLALAALALITVVRKAIPRVQDAYHNDASPVWGSIRATGPYVGHIGLIMLLLGVTFNVAYQASEQKQIKVGQTLAIADQTVRLDSAQISNFPDRQSLAATISILNGEGGVSAVVVPQLDAFSNSEQLHNEVGITVSPARDIYIVIDQLNDETKGAEVLTITVYDNPAVVWIWIGGALLVLGGLLFAIPRRRKLVDVQGETTSSTDDELSHLLEAAIVAARAGQMGSGAGDPVTDLLTRAQALSSAQTGGDASQDDVVAFLEQAKDRVEKESSTSSGQFGSGPPPSRQGGGPPLNKPKRTGLWVVLGIVAAIVVAGGAYLTGHATGSTVPGIDAGAPLTDSPTGASASAAPAVDQTQVAALMKKIAADPKDAKSLRDLGNIYYTASDFKNAVTFYDKVVVVNPKDDDAWVAVGAAAFNLGDTEKAKEAWLTAIEVNPKNPEAHYDLGFAYLSQKTPDNDAAKAEWQKVVDLDPTSDWAKDAQSMLSEHVSGSGAPAASAAPSSSASP
jgi:cytochrome c-type biogenesis protein CcmF